MSDITTFTGQRFDPVHPEEELIDILDIAHALSMICRGNGHLCHFYSVAQHSLACAREAKKRCYSREMILGALLHDASEAYLSDVTRPIKKQLPLYLEVEDNLQNLIWRHFIGRDLTEDEKERIFAIDDAMLSEEFHQLMPREISEKRRELLNETECALKKPEDVREEFISFFEEI